MGGGVNVHFSFGRLDGMGRIVPVDLVDKIPFQLPAAKS